MIWYPAVCPPVTLAFLTCGDLVPRSLWLSRKNLVGTPAPLEPQSFTEPGAGSEACSQAHSSQFSQFPELVYLGNFGTFGT